MNKMAQFDVYPNPSIAQRQHYPFVVVLQSDQLDHHTTRWVMPLARLHKQPVNTPRRLAMTIVVDQEELHLAAHLSAPLPARSLKQPLMNVRERSSELLDALDAVISGV